jgi:chromosome segregation ATPase
VLSDLNDDLRRRLKQAELAELAAEAEHGRQVAELRAQLQRAQEEPASLRLQIQSLQQQCRSTEECDMEVSLLQSELAGARDVIHQLETLIGGFEAKYSDRNIDRVRHLEDKVKTLQANLADTEGECKELAKQLERHLLKGGPVVPTKRGSASKVGSLDTSLESKQTESRADAGRNISIHAEYEEKLLALQEEIDRLHHQFEQKEKDFVVSLQLSTRKLAMDLTAAQASEKAHRASKEHLENMLGHQNSHFDLLSAQIASLNIELSRMTEAATEHKACKLTNERLEGVIKQKEFHIEQLTERLVILKTELGQVLELTKELTQCKIETQRLESVVSQQEAQIAKQEVQMEAWKQEAEQVPVLAKQLAASKEAARFATSQQQVAHMEKTEAQTALEAALSRQKDTHETEREALQAEVWRLKAQLNSTGMTDLQLVCEFKRFINKEFID